MTLVHSVDLPLGSLMPAFCLSDPSGKEFNSSTLLAGKGLLVVFICNHCPYAYRFLVYCTFFYTNVDQQVA